MTLPRRCFIAFALVLPLALAACGGGGGSSTAKPTKAEFVKQGDALCTQFRQELATFNKKLSAATSSAAQARLLHDLATTLQAQVSKFQALQSPAGDEAVIKKYLDGMRSQTRSVDQAASALEAGDAQKAQTLIQAMGASTTRLKGIAEGYGFKVCGSQ